MFTGASASLGLLLTGTPASDFATLRYSVDDAPYVDVRLPGGVRTNPLPLATGLKDGNHTLLIMLKNSLQSVDRWVPTCKLVITRLGSRWRSTCV